jgi:hypothetical protein
MGQKCRIHGANYYHVYGVRAKKIAVSGSDDWIYWHFGYNLP